MRSVALTVCLLLLASPALAKKDAKELIVGGRVLARIEMRQEEGKDSEGEQSLRQARIEIEWRRGDWLRMLVEAELANGPEVKDAWLNLRWCGLGLRAGNFKQPISAMMLTSSWKLPTVGRGTLDDILKDRFQIGGRRPGVQVEAKRDVGRAELFGLLGTFQASDPYGELYGVTAGLEARTVTARAGVVRGPLAVALSGQARAMGHDDPTDLHWYWAAGLDAEVDLELAAQGLRAWVDVMAGSYAVPAVTDVDGETFLVARAIAAWRHGGLERAQFYVEPYVLAGYMEPGLDLDDDVMAEAAVGVNVGAWRHARVTLQGEVFRASAGTPRVSPVSVGASVGDSEAIRLQLGAAF